MAPAINALTDQQLRQLVALLATSATSSSMDRAAADIDAIGWELWRRTQRTAAAAPVEPR